MARAHFITGAGGAEKHTINVRNASWPSRAGRRQAGHQAPTRAALNLHAADDLPKSYGPRRDEGVAPVDVIRVSPAQLALHQHVPAPLRRAKSWMAQSI